MKRMGYLAACITVMVMLAACGGGKVDESQLPTRIPTLGAEAFAVIPATATPEPAVTAVETPTEAATPAAVSVMVTQVMVTQTAESATGTTPAATTPATASITATVETPVAQTPTSSSVTATVIGTAELTATPASALPTVTPMATSATTATIEATVPTTVTAAETNTPQTSITETVTSTPAITQTTTPTATAEMSQTPQITATEATQTVTTTAAPTATASSSVTTTMEATPTTSAPAASAAEQANPELAGLPEEIAKAMPNADPKHGQQLTVSNACIGCHSLDPNQKMVGPTWYNLVETAAKRVPGESAGLYLYNSIVKPNAFVVPGYAPNIMLQTFGQSLTAQDKADLIAYLLTLHGQK